MLEAFGIAVSEIFNDPKLKEKAREFGKAARSFGENVADHCKTNKKER